MATERRTVCARRNVMKVFKSILAITLALAFTIPAFAGGNDKQAQEQCQSRWRGAVAKRVLDSP